jgi:hypothetical protein
MPATKSPSSIIGHNGPLSYPTPAAEPWRREPLNLPHFGHSLPQPRCLGGTPERSNSVEIQGP